MDPVGYEALKHFGFLELLGHGDHQEIKGGLARSEIFVCGRIHKCKVPSAARAPAGSMSWKMTAKHCELPFSTMMRMTDNTLLYMIYIYMIYIYMYIYLWIAAKIGQRIAANLVHQTLCSVHFLTQLPSKDVFVISCLCLMYFVGMHNHHHHV